MKTFSLFFCSCLIAAAMHAQIIHVPADYPAIQLGINAAISGDTVLVADGTYYENINFLSKRPLMVASEFLMDGDTSHISNTIINGSQPVNPDIGSVVTFESGEDTTSVLCGFTITGGTGTMEPSYDMRMGGGIHIKYAGGKLLNNYVRDNTVTHSGAVAGGGMQLGGPVTVIPWVVLRGNRIFNNHAVSTANSGGGGGVVCFYNLIMENNDVSYNEINGHWTVDGGGMYCFGEFGPIELRIGHNTFTRNLAITDLGSMGYAGFGSGISFYTNCWGTINNNIISFNSIHAPASFRSYGPGVCVEGIYTNSFVFGNNIIEGNSSTSQNTWGGGLSLISSGGVYQNNVIRNNNAYHGGGVSILNPNSVNVTATLINNTITGNDAGGLYLFGSKVVVINSILYNNTPSGTAINSVSSNLEVRYSDVEDVTTWPGEGNVLCNPQFVSDGYHLECSSMLFEKGISSIEIGGVTYNCPSYDIDGDLRPFAGGVPEIGADELRTAAWTEEYRTADLTIYPNPASEKIIVELTNKLFNLNRNVSVCDVTGQELIQQNVSGSKTEIDISSLPAGVYFIRLLTGNNLITNKIVKVN